MSCQCRIDAKSVQVRFVDEQRRRDFRFRVGQFGLWSRFGAGESTFNLCGSSTWHDRLKFCFRRVGKVTDAFWSIEPGETIGFRGNMATGTRRRSGRGATPSASLEGSRYWDGQVGFVPTVLDNAGIPAENTSVPYAQVSPASLVAAVCLSGYSPLLIEKTIGAYPISAKQTAPALHAAGNDASCAGIPGQEAPDARFHCPRPGYGGMFRNPAGERDPMEGTQVRVLRGTTFMVSNQQGDIPSQPAAEIGLFFRDMRHLSQWEIRVDGRPLTPVCGEAVAQDEAMFFLAEATESMAVAPAYTLVRQRCIVDGMVEKLRLTSHDNTSRRISLTVLADADFVDTMHLPRPPEQRGHRYHRAGSDTLTFGYRRGDFQRQTVITAEDAFFTPRAICFHFELEPGQTWERDVRLTVQGSDAPPAGKSVGIPAAGWLRDAPRMDSIDGHLSDTYQHSIEDLVALQWQTNVDRLTVPGAGLPKFMALFGRDSLLTAYEALPFLPQMCRSTLRVLAAYQAADFVDATDAEPGKILHELRLGEVATFRDQPYDPYYGSVDSTPLFIIMLDEYERWTGDADTVRELEGPARAALAWLRVHADRDANGFLRYHTRNREHGLANQCWKDSDDSIVHPDGSLARLPRATCEVQGYAYDARRRAARLARAFWSDPDLARELDREADHLRTAFTTAYWLPDEGFYALALDGVGEPVRTLTSNIGHLLWSGIVADEHVEPVVEHLMSDRLFSGWGVRTLAEHHLAYNPMGYHTGSVWPHDTAIIALGLARYGRWNETRTLAEAGLTAATHMGHRLPETLIGTAREVTRVPVILPGATWPHGWSCGAPLLLLRAVLGLEPTDSGPVVQSAAAIGGITLHDLPGRWGRATVRTAGDTADRRIREVVSTHL